MTRGRRLLWLLAVVAVGLAARAPLHRATRALPLSNDDALCLLTARQVLVGELSTVPWNQPYSGTLDSYLLAPWLALFSPGGVFRGYQILCALLLVFAVGRLAHHVAGERAGWLAALLAACGTPYVALMGAVGPIPNFLMPLLVAWPAARGLRWLAEGSPGVSGRELTLLGLLCGLTVWNSVLALPALLGVAAGLLVAGGGAGRLGRAGAWVTVGLAVGSFPAVVGRLLGASGASSITALRPMRLWREGLADLTQAGVGLLGLEIPQVIDGPERDVLPLALRWLLGAGLGALVAVGASRRRAWPMLGWLAAQCAAFVLSRRTGGSEVRYVFAAAVPLLVLAGAGLERVLSRQRLLAALLGLAVAVPWGLGHAKLVSRWREPGHTTRVWQVPPLEPVVETLERARVGSAYATLQVAGRLALESEGRVIVSQAWNERFPGNPLRFRDEVDLDPAAAWVLSPHLSRGMPRAGGFRALLGQLEGNWSEDRPGDFVVFRRFQPPFDETRPVPGAEISITDLSQNPLPGTLLDGDPATRWVSPRAVSRGSGLSLRLAAERRLSALVLVVDLEDSPLAIPWACDMAGETVARGPGRYTLQWVAGVPRPGRQALLTIVLGDRPASELRLVFQGEGAPLALSEVLVYGPDEAPRPSEGAEASRGALEAARVGRWDEAVAGYARAVQLEPHRASYHAWLARARWRAAQRRLVDVESLDDGGPELVAKR